MRITTIGLDLAKHVFQLHGIDDAGGIVVRKQLRRGQVLEFFAGLEPCLVGMEACATSHYWARQLQVLGHQVRLMPPQYVKAYVKRNKNDSADAEAICEAVTRPSMRFVPIKTVDQQAALVMHRSRDLLIRQRTMLVNALRGHLAEFGVIAAQGINKIGDLEAVLVEECDERIPEALRGVLIVFLDQLADLNRRIDEIELRIRRWHTQSDTSRRLATIPGIGVITATAIAASVPDGSVFRSGREFAAWLGIVPRQNSTGGKQRLGGISKRGDGYIRRLLIIGAQAVLRWSTAKRSDPWVIGLLARKPRMVAAVAVANKMARIAWAIMIRNTKYRPSAATS